MNDIADKIWAAIQRASPPVTKDEIVALVNEGQATTTPSSRYQHIPHCVGQQLVPDAPAGLSGGILGKSPAKPELSEQVITALVDEMVKLTGIAAVVDERLSGPDVHDTVVEKHWFDGEAVQRLRIPTEAISAMPDAAELDEQAKIAADWAAGKFRIVPLNPGDKVITRVTLPDACPRKA